MIGVLGHDSALQGYTGPRMNFVMTHVPGEASIARSVDQQSSALLLNHGCPFLHLTRRLVQIDHAKEKIEVSICGIYLCNGPYVDFVHACSKTIQYEYCNWL